MPFRTTRRGFLGGLCAGAAGLGMSQAQGSVWRFVNRTGGKFGDDQCFWSLTHGREWQSFKEKPTAPIAGNGRVYFYLGTRPRNFDDLGTYWDFIEYNFAKETWYGNTTQVDAFCIPMTIELGREKVGITESRSKLFEAFRKECPKEFQGCVKGDLRILSPHRAGFDKDGPQARYFEKYVDEVWARYAEERKTPGGKFTGKVVDGALTFTPVEGKAKPWTCARKPTTQEILLGTGVLGQNPPFCAAFNRHVAADPGDWHAPEKFYRGEPSNWYSKFLHEHSLGRKAYGFCYDDAADQAAYFAGKGAEVVVTLTWD